MPSIEWRKQRKHRRWWRLPGNMPMTQQAVSSGDVGRGLPFCREDWLSYSYFVTSLIHSLFNWTGRDGHIHCFSVRVISVYHTARPPANLETP